MAKTVKVGHASAGGKNPEAIRPSKAWPRTTSRIPKPLAISRDSSRRPSRAAWLGFAAFREAWDGVKESVSPGIGSSRPYRFPVYMGPENRLCSRGLAEETKFESGMLLDGEGHASRVAC